MLTDLNIAANIVIFFGSVWALLTQKVPTRTFGSAVLGMIAIAAIVNMDTSACHSRPETLLNVAVAIGVLWAFWRLELRHYINRRCA